SHRVRPPRVGPNNPDRYRHFLGLPRSLHTHRHPLLPNLTVGVWTRGLLNPVPLPCPLGRNGNQTPFFFYRKRYLRYLYKAIPLLPPGFCPNKNKFPCP